jgi:hypothetical protein
MRIFLLFSLENIPPVFSSSEEYSHENIPPVFMRIFLLIIFLLFSLLRRNIPPVFMSFLFFGSRRNRFVLQSEVMSLVTILQPGGLGPRIYITVAQLHPRMRIFLLFSLLRRNILMKTGGIFS